MAKRGFVRSYAYSAPMKPSKGKTVFGKFVNGVTFAGTKVGQWTVRPSVKAYDVGKGKKK